MNGIDDLQTLKQRLAARGINSRGCRLYLDYGYSLFLPLGPIWCNADKKEIQGDSEVAWLKILQACEMDVLPPPELVQSIAEWGLPGNCLESIPPMFLRAAWKACVAAQYGDDGIDEFVETGVTPLARWFFHSDIHQTANVMRLKAGWDSLVRLRQESVHIEARKLGVDDWPPIVRRFDSGGLRMVALCSEHDLMEEGESMDHCVSTYADSCRTEPLRIFSIRQFKSGSRVATLSVRESGPGEWNFDQLKGPRNAAVDVKVWQEADALLQVMNKVSQQDPKIRTFLDFIHSLAPRPAPPL